MTEKTPNRRSTRVNHEVLVGVTSEAKTFTGWGTNLSMGGVFVNSQETFPRDLRVSVLLQLPGAPDLKLAGRVAWSAAGPGVDEVGMGIEFVDANPEAQRLLGAMVERLAADLSRPAK